jgi:hypothetical protein
VMHGDCECCKDIADREAEVERLRAQLEQADRSYVEQGIRLLAERAEVKRLRLAMEEVEAECRRWRTNRLGRAHSGRRPRSPQGRRGVMATYSANSVPNPPRKLCYVEDHARLYFEVERLRAALERISEMWTGIDTASSIARAALKGGGE